MMRSLRGSSLRSRLSRTLIGLGLASVVLLASVNYVIVRELLSSNTEIQLETLRDVRADSIEVAIDRLLTRTSALGSDPSVAAALSEFEDAYQQLDDDITEDQLAELSAVYEPVVQRYDDAEVDRPLIAELIPTDIPGRYVQYHYIAAQPADERAEVVDAEDGSTYSDVHARHHEFLSELATTIGATDLLLLGNDTRDVIYSVSKRVDLGTDGFDGPYGDAGLGRALTKLAGVAVDESTLSDTMFYLPDSSAPVVHAATTVRLGSGVVGALVLVVPVEGLTSIVTANQNWDLLGLGDTGEAYLVGADRLLRTVPRPWFEDSEAYLERFLDVTGDERAAELMRFTGSPVLIQGVDNAVIDEALEGDVAIGRVNNYLDRATLASAQPLDVGGLGWIVVTEQGVGESRDELMRFVWSVLILLAVLLTVLAAVGAVLARQLARPVKPLVDTAGDIAEGDYETHVPDLGNNELGDVGRQLQSVADRLREREASIQSEEDRIAKMLSSVLPASFVERVRQGERELVEVVDTATVIAIAVRGIPAPSAAEQDALVEMTSQLSSNLTELARAHGVERVKVVLEQQMFVAGRGEAGVAADQAASFAAAARLAIPEIGREHGLDIDVRVGMSAGLVASGVLGSHQLSFDVWGSSVNLAVQLASRAAPGEILVDSSVVDEMSGDVEYQPVEGTDDEFRLGIGAPHQ